MKQVLFTVLFFCLIGINKNAICKAIVLANCPHFNESLNCLEPANWETWIRISVEFEPDSEIENTNWSVDFSVSDPSQYTKIPKSAFVNYGGGLYLLRSMYRFPIPTNAQSYVFALFLMSENNAVQVSEDFPFYICGNSSNKLSNPNNFNLNEAKNYSNTNFDQFSNLDNFKFYPNPIVSDFTIEYPANKDEKITLQIFDIEGRSIFITQFQHQQTSQNIKYFDSLNLSRGVYFCNIRSKSFQRTIKLSKL